MIDLRCHVISHADCGPQNFTESLEMCRLAYQEGVHTIVATPRWEAGATKPPLAFTDCQRNLEALERETGVSLSLKLGFLMQFSPDLPKLADTYGAKLALAGGRYILVSMPSLHTPHEAEMVWSELARRGFSVVVSRPECSPALRQNPSRLERWVAGDVLLQIDAASVTGAHGREVQRFAAQCVRKYIGKVVIASNAHGQDLPRKSLCQAYAVLIKAHGENRARMCVEETPAMVISGMPAYNQTKEPARQFFSPRNLIQRAIR